MEPPTYRESAANAAALEVAEALLERDRLRSVASTAEEVALVAAADALVAAARDSHPKVAKKLPARGDLSPRAFYEAVSSIYTSGRSIAEATAVVRPVSERLERLTNSISELQTEVAVRVCDAAPHAVFRAARGARNAVRESSPGDYRSTGNGVTYARFLIVTASESLRRRGFVVETEEVPSTMFKGDVAVFRLLTDAPPLVRDLLGTWRLDEATLFDLAEKNGAVNLKVYYHGNRNYWDVPRDRRETREHPDFAALRANEDAHATYNTSRKRRVIL